MFAIRHTSRYYRLAGDQVTNDIAFMALVIPNQGCRRSEAYVWGGLTQLETFGYGYWRVLSWVEIVVLGAIIAA